MQKEHDLASIMPKETFTTYTELLLFFLHDDNFISLITIGLLILFGFKETEFCLFQLFDSNPSNFSQRFGFLLFGLVNFVGKFTRTDFCLFKALFIKFT